MFKRLDTKYEFIVGRVSHPSMNWKWVDDHIALYKWITQEKGYIRILAKRYNANMDATIPTIKQSQQD